MRANGSVSVDGGLLPAAKSPVCILVACAVIAAISPFGDTLLLALAGRSKRGRFALAKDSY